MYNLPWDSNHAYKNINSLLHDYLAVKIVNPQMVVDTNVLLFDQNTDAIKLTFSCVKNPVPDPDEYMLSIDFTIEPGTYPQIIFDMMC